MARIEVWDTDENSPTYGEKVERFSVDVREQEKTGHVSRVEDLKEALADAAAKREHLAEETAAADEKAKKAAEGVETPASIAKKLEPKKKPPVAKG